MTTGFRPGQRLKQHLKRPIRRLVRIVGYELVARSEDESADIFAHLLRAGVSLVLDVGANQGQYAERLRAAGYTGDIVSFEPGTQAFKLLQKAAAADPRWSVRRAAVGSEEGSLVLNVSANSVSSSLLGVNQLHLEAAASSEVIRTEQVEVIDLASLYVESDDRAILLKIDTQGFELPVLEGLGALADRVQLVQVELSLVELYLGQASYLQVLLKLEQLGFEPVGVLPGFAHPETRDLLQMDVLARRRRRAT